MNPWPITTEPDPSVLACLLDFISSEFKAGDPVDPYEQLVGSLVDSIGVFVLAEKVESEFQVTLDDLDLSAENLVTTRALATLITQRRHYAGKVG